MGQMFSTPPQQGVPFAAVVVAKDTGSVCVRFFRARVGMTARRDVGLKKRRHRVRLFGCRAGTVADALKRFCRALREAVDGGLRVFAAAGTAVCQDVQYLT